jgi:hypothetical protein
MRWFVPEFVARFAAIGVTPTAIVEFVRLAPDDPNIDSVLNAIDRIILPWDIDVPRVECLLEFCDVCAKMRMGEWWERQQRRKDEPESAAGPGGPT